MIVGDLGDDVLVVVGGLRNHVLVILGQVNSALLHLLLGDVVVDAESAVEVVVRHVLELREEDEDSSGPDHAEAEDGVGASGVEEQERAHEDVENALSDAGQEEEEVPLDAGQVEAGAHDDDAEETLEKVEGHDAEVPEEVEVLEDVEDPHPGDHGEASARDEVDVPRRLEQVDSEAGGVRSDLASRSGSVRVEVLLLADVSSHSLNSI
mmetsp:Transcript_14193/g.24127  ORF Transcript_14193/g.24127 Transcript_14193/m.24127 type:complete len:209 (-) Transcript_14193:26-652(-)